MNYAIKLQEKINGYKSYNQAVKDRVLKQLNNVEVNEVMYNKAVKALPNVMKANKAFTVKYNRLLKSVKGLERHSYAPEMNALHFKGGEIIKTPQKTTVEDALTWAINNSKI